MALFDFYNKEEKKEIKPYKRSDVITISLYPVEEEELTTEKSKATDTEEAICISLKNKISSDRSLKYSFSIEHKSLDYTTLVYRNTDLARVKWTEETHYIKLFISSDLLSKYKNDPRFDSQKNKNEIMWRCNLQFVNDIETLYPIILDVFDSIDGYCIKYDLTEKEKAYLKVGFSIICDISNDSDNIYLNKTSQYLSLMYKASMDLVKIKPYKKSKWRYYYGNRRIDYEYAKKVGLFKGTYDEFSGYDEIANPEDLYKYKEYMQLLFEYYMQHEKYYLENFEPSFYQKINFEDLN